MSLYHFGDWMHELDHNVRPTQLINQHFGLGLTPDDLLAPVLAPFAMAPHPHSAQMQRQQQQSVRGPTRTNSTISLPNPPLHHEDHYLHRMLHHPSYADLRHYYRPWHLARKDHGSIIKHDKDNFVINLDVQQFLPDEIVVKVVDNSILVDGKHEEKQDEHGFIARQFTRRYIVPDGHDLNKIQSHLSSDGILSITVPKIGEEIKNEERIIPIIHTGPHKHLKEENIEKTDAK